MDFVEGGRFRQLRRDGAYQFVRRDAFADGDFQLLSNRMTDCQRNVGWRFLSVCGEVEISLINRSLLHVRREVVAVAEHPVRELLVTLEITRKDDQLWAKFPRAHGGHRRVNAKFPRLVRSRRDDAAPLAANRNRFPAELRIAGLLDGGEESVRVQMDNDSWH